MTERAPTETTNLDGYGKDGRIVAPYSAPSAGPPSWDLYRFTFDTVIGLAGAEPYGATRWRFRRAR